MKKNKKRKNKKKQRSHSNNMINFLSVIILALIGMPMVMFIIQKRQQSSTNRTTPHDDKRADNQGDNPSNHQQLAQDWNVGKVVKVQKGDSRIGTVVFIRMLHRPRDLQMANRVMMPKKRLIGYYQHRITEMLLELKPDVIFPEGLSNRVDWIDDGMLSKVKQYFPKGKTNASEASTMWLYEQNEGAAFQHIYYMLTSKVIPLMPSADIHDAERLSKLTLTAYQKGAFKHLQYRGNAVTNLPKFLLDWEQRMANAVKAYLKSHPGKFVVILFGSWHSFGKYFVDSGMDYREIEIPFMLQMKGIGNK